MLREYVGDKEVGDIHGGSIVSSRNEDGFLGEVINNDKDGGVSVRGGELLNEIHTD